MRVRSSSKLRITQHAATLLLGLSACGKADHSVDVVTKDAGPSDAGPARDAQAADAAAGDAAVGYSGDASLDEDAGTPSDPFDPAQDCAAITENSELSTTVPFREETGFAIAPGLTGFGVAFQHNDCGALGVMPVAALGDFAKPTVLLDDCASVAQGVSLLHGSDGYRLSWVDNASGSAELQMLQLLDSLKAPAVVKPARITDNQLRELAPVQASLANTDYLAWIALDPTTHKRAVMLQSANAEPRTLVAADAGYSPIRLALAQLGDDSGALAFVSDQGQGGIYLVPLDDAGQPREAPVRLSAAVGAASSVDVATREEDGGAVVYSVDVGGRNEVRFRRLDTHGAFFSDEVKVVTFPLHGRDASITRLGGGYVVAFRSMSDPAAVRGEIRLAFVSKEGNLQRDSAGRVTTYPVAEASTTGGRVTARISRDGQLLIGFLDIDTTDSSEGPQLRLIRKRLDCAL